MSSASERPRVLITGARGFLGTNLARHLHELGAQLTLVTHQDVSPSSLPAALPDVPRLTGPAREVLAALDLGRFDVLLHLASATNPSLGTLDDELAQLAELSAILEQARAQAPGLRLIYPSSGGTVYGEGSEPHQEDEFLRPGSSYAWGKAASESLLAYHGRAHGRSYLILRCANPYGPYQRVERRQGLIARLLHDLRDGREVEIWGDGEAVRDYFYVGDLCQLVEAALARPEVSGVFNVGSGQGLSVHQVLAAAAEVVGQAPRVRYVAARPGMVARNVLAVERVEQAFGWRATTSLAAGIQATWAWVQRP